MGFTDDPWQVWTWFRRVLGYVLVAYVAICLTSPVAGDTVKLRSGKTITGVIVDEGETHIRISTNKGTLGIPRQEVLAITHHNANSNAVEAILAALGSYRYREAIALLASVPADGRSRIDEALANRLEQLVTTTILTEAERIALDHYIIHRDTPPKPSLLQAYAHFLLRTDDLAQATTLLMSLPVRNSTLGQPRSREVEVSHAIVSDVMRALVLADQLTSAIQLAEHFARISGVEKPADALIFAMLNEARRTAEGGAPLEALDVIQNHALPYAPALAYRTAKEILRFAESQTSASERLQIYSRIEDMFGDAIFQQDMKDLYRRHVALLCSDADFDTATSIATKLNQWSPDFAAELLLEIEYERRRSRIAPNNTVALYQLACWAQEIGLVSRAEFEFARLQRDPLVGKNAQLRLHAMELERDRQTLAQARRAFEQGDYSPALVLANRLVGKQQASEFTTSARTLMELARFYASKESSRLKTEAGARYQQAERLYYQQRYFEALPILISLQVDFPKSGIARMAARLRRVIEAKLPKDPGDTESARWQAEIERRQIEEMHRLALRLPMSTGRD